MPRYDYFCERCGKRVEHRCSLSEYRREIDCPHCGERVERCFDPDSAPFVINDIEPYYDRGLDMHIQSRTDKRAILKEKGLVEVGNDLLNPVAERRKERRELKKQSAPAIKR